MTWRELATQFKNRNDKPLATYCLSRAYTCEDGFEHYLRDIVGYDDLYLPFHSPIIKQVADLSVRRRMLQACRGSFKSSIATIGFASWMIARDMALSGTCNIRILIASESLELARFFAKSTGQVILHTPLWRELFGEHRGDRTVRKKWLDYEFTSLHRTQPFLKEPTVHTGATEAPRTGNHYDIIILDDLEAERRSATRDQIDKVHMFYKLVIPLLEPKVPGHLRDTPSGIPVIPNPILQLVSTRWHHDDIYARIEKEIADNENEDWSWVVSPAEDKEGAPTFPDRFPTDELGKLKQEMGIYAYSCQMLLDPTPESERDFKRTMIQYSRPDQYRRPSLRTFIGADFAYTQQQRIDTGEIRKADYTVIFTLLVDDLWNYIVKDVWRKRASKSEAITELFRQYVDHKALNIGLQRYDRAQIEETITNMGYQSGVRPRLEWITYPTRQSKNDRILTVLQPIMEARKLFLLPRCEWLEDEFMDFPRGAFDDGLDALCNAVKVAKPPVQQHTKPAVPALIRHIQSLQAKTARKIGLSGQRYQTVPGEKSWKRP